MDVRARRLDLTRGALRALLEAGELDGFRVVTEELAGEFDPLDVAAAAVKLAHEATQGPSAAEEEHIPSLPPPREYTPGAKGDRGKAGGAPWERGAKDAAASDGKKKPARAGRPGSGTMVRLWVSLGRQAGLRPADLVGAIANEAGISAREIGGIEIEDRFSLVEVSDHAADQAVQALRATSLRGQRVVVRRDQPKKSTQKTYAAPAAKPDRKDRKDKPRKPARP
jgi:ATP-dependent RNA helicase DeaD